MYVVRGGGRKLEERGQYNYFGTTYCYCISSAGQILTFIDLFQNESIKVEVCKSPREFYSMDEMGISIHTLHARSLPIAGIKLRTPMTPCS